MSEEQMVELRYEAGMYKSLYDVAKARIEALEAALREIENGPSMFDNGEMVIDVAYGRGIIKGLENAANIARAALDKDTLCSEETIS